MFGAFAALLVTIGVLLLALRLLGRLQGTPLRPGRRSHMQVIDRVATGPRNGVVLLRVSRRVLIVGIGERHTLLGELTGDELHEALAAERAAVPATPRPAWLARFGLLLALLAAPAVAQAQSITAPPPTPNQGRPTAGAPTRPVVPTPSVPSVDLRVGTGTDQVQLSGAVGVVVLMGVLTLLPAIFMLMTSFTRIVIVLSFLRSALGTQSAPPTQLLVAIAVILTGMVMQPVMSEVNRDALQPYLQGSIGQVEAYKTAVQPMRRFMLANTRERDLDTFVELTADSATRRVEDVPTMTVMSAFIASELRTSFQMGFVIFLPFLVIDLIVASVLMSMGMFMLPPVMVSLPFKLLLFVLADGWALVMRNLVGSFRLA